MIQRAPHTGTQARPGCRMPRRLARVKRDKDRKIYITSPSPRLIRPITPNTAAIANTLASIIYLLV